MPHARRELTLLLTDLYLDAELHEHARESSTPALRALELVLARAGARETVGWRDWALRCAGVHRLASIPIAALSRLASGGAEPSGNWWLATAVDLQAAHDHVQLAQVLSLRDEEWRTLASDFNRVFGAGACTMVTGEGVAAYLRFDEPVEATSVDPERIAGGDVHDALPGGAQGHVLRRLMTETQMWLHEHPLNLERTARGEPAVTGLWFWGGGDLAPRPPRGSLPALVATDPFLRGVWRWAGVEAPSLPPTFEAARTALAQSASGCVAAVALREQRGATWAERLAEIDREWLAPALAALRAGAISLLRVHASDTLLTLRPRDLWRVWRRPRPWMEALA